MKILAPESIKPFSKLFEQNFEILIYQNLEELKELLNAAQILFVHSTINVNEELIHSSKLQGVATLSSGSCHIDGDYLQKNNMFLLDAKGANKEAVRDYILSVLAYLYQKNLIQKEKIGIIGYGYVGKLVSDTLKELSYEVYIYDPFIMPDNSIDNLANTDIILVHPNLHDGKFASRNLLNAAFFQMLKPESILINASRGGIVNEDDLLKAKNLIYCTDIYQDEPFVNEDIIEKAIICTPHIAGHSIECKENIIKLICQKIHAQFSLQPPQEAFYNDKPLILPKSDWQNWVLSLYNPEKESFELKKSKNKSETFLKLRKLHNNRHNFTYY